MIDEQKHWSMKRLCVCVCVCVCVFTITWSIKWVGFSGGSVVKDPPANAGDTEMTIDP